MTDKQAQALKSINSVVENIEVSLRDIKDSKEEFKAKTALKEIKRILKTVIKSTETLEDRIQSKLKEL